MWNVVTICLFIGVFLIIFFQWLWKKYWRRAALEELQQRSTIATRIANENNHLRRSITTQNANRRNNRRTGHGHGVFIISDGSSNEQRQTPPPEYKWEDELPPSYEEALDLSDEQIDPPATSLTLTDEVEQHIF